MLSERSANDLKVSIDYVATNGYVSVSMMVLDGIRITTDESSDNSNGYQFFNIAVDSSHSVIPVIGDLYAPMDSSYGCICLLSDEFGASVLEEL